MNHVFQNEDTARSVSTILTQQCTRPLTHTPRLRPEDITQTSAGTHPACWDWGSRSLLGVQKQITMN